MLFLRNRMNRLRTEPAVESQQLTPQRAASTAVAHDAPDDEIFLNDDGNEDDQQAHIRRRAPTRHSIKSLPGRKAATKQPSNPTATGTNTEVTSVRPSLT